MSAKLAFMNLHCVPPLMSKSCHNKTKLLRVSADYYFNLFQLGCHSFLDTTKVYVTKEAVYCLVISIFFVVKR
jgi:hypothetical protein